MSSRLAEPWASRFVERLEAGTIAPAVKCSRRQRVTSTAARRDAGWGKNAWAVKPHPIAPKCCFSFDRLLKLNGRTPRGGAAVFDKGMYHMPQVNDERTRSWDHACIHHRQKRRESLLNIDFLTPTRPVGRQDIFNYSVLDPDGRTFNGNWNRNGAASLVVADGKQHGPPRRYRMCVQASSQSLMPEGWKRAEPRMSPI